MGTSARSAAACTRSTVSAISSFTGIGARLGDSCASIWLRSRRSSTIRASRSASLRPDAIRQVAAQHARRRSPPWSPREGRARRWASSTRGSRWPQVADERSRCAAPPTSRVERNRTRRTSPSRPAGTSATGAPGRVDRRGRWEVADTTCSEPRQHRRGAWAACARLRPMRSTTTVRRSLSGSTKQPMLNGLGARNSIGGSRATCGETAMCPLAWLTRTRRSSRAYPPARRRDRANRPVIPGPPAGSRSSW